MEGQAFFFFLIALALAYAVGCWGRTRKIGFGLAFFLALLNVIIGVIAVACSKKLDNNSSTQKEPQP